VIPVDDSFLYVLPIYVQSTTSSQIPELKRVIVVNGSGGDVSIQPSLLDALQEAAGAPVTGGNGGPAQGNGGGSTEQRIQRLLDRALEHFQAANDALTSGDLGTYQQEFDAAQQLVARARQLANTVPSTGQGPTTSPSPTAAPSASASPSASISPSPSSSQ
jgi:uncharacterized protein